MPPQIRPNQNKRYLTEKFKNIEDFMALSMFFREPAPRVLPSAREGVGMQHTVASILSMGAGPALIYR